MVMGCARYAERCKLKTGFLCLAVQGKGTGKEWIMTIRELYYKFANHFNSKVFTAMLKSFLVVLSLPIIINVLVAGISLNTIEKETIRFAENILKKSEDEIERSYGEAFQLMNFIKNNDLIVDYIKSGVRNPWTEFQISRLLSQIAPSYKTIETAYIYFKDYNYVLSATSGGQDMYFSQYYYNVSHEEWKKVMDTDWRGKRESLRGKDDSVRNLVVSSVLPGEQYKDKATITVQLNNSTLDNVIDHYKLNTQDQIVIFWDEQMVYSTSNYSLTPEEEQVLYHAQSGKKINILTDRYNILRREQESSGLKLFYLQNKSQESALLLFNKWFVVISLSVYILISFILSFFITRKNFTPIQKVFSLFQENEPLPLLEDYETMENNIRSYISKHNNMTRKLKQYENDLKEVYLEKLIYGKIVEEESIKEGAKLHNLQFGTGYSILILFQIKEEEEIGIGENTVHELLYELGMEFFTHLREFYLLKENSGFIALLNGNGASANQFDDRITQESVALQKYLKQSENLNIEINISKTFDKLSEIHHIYEEVLQQEEKKEENSLVKQSDQEKQCSMERILEIIKQDIEDCNLSTAEVAQRLNITQSYLSRYFKQQMGIGVLDYIHRYRINMAKNLMLVDHNIRIKEVAEKTGFYNVSSFIRVFKKNEGITPGEFRDSLL